MKKTTIFSIVSAFIAVVLVLVISVGSLGFTNWDVKTWFKYNQQNIAKPDGSTSIPEKDNHNGGLLVSEVVESGISVVSTVLPRTAYEANGISTQADSACLLTVNVNPDTATNKQMDWSINWVDGSSGFASGKSVTDYVKLTPTSNGALTANVECKQAFGSQIKVSVVSKDNSKATAQCILDYSQKVQNVSLKFGDMVANLGGTTEVKFNINPNGVGPGGATNLQYDKSSVYTLADNFTATVSLSNDMSDTGQYIYMKLKGSTITTGTYNRYPEKELYFDYPHAVSQFYITGRNTDIHFKNLSTSEIAGYFSDITEGRMFNVDVTISGEYTNYTISSKFVCTGYINQARVSSIEMDQPSVIL
ncbi:MAG: hypothetical protein K2L70_00075 [Clostridia bacterium]|nr:hypothetical protein [Clostridia bacterium]